MKSEERRAKGEERRVRSSKPYALCSMPYAFLFSGQGSQYAGMGTKLQRYSAGREAFQEASDVLGMDIAYLCCNGTDRDLVGTEITQPVILTCSIAALRILEEKAKSRHETSDRRHKTGDLSLKSQVSCLTNAPQPSATAGLSVGEYSALVASEVLSFADALRLVKERGHLMAEAAAANPGTMVAILGLDSAVVESICEEASKNTHRDDTPAGIPSVRPGGAGELSHGVWPANYNCPGQIVVSGEEKAVQRAVELAQKAGAKRCIALDVSGAFHSPLMCSAELGLRSVLSSVSFSKPRIPFIANVTGDYVEEPEQIKENLALQLSNPIQWEASISRMLDDGITTFTEVGPGKVLAGLARRISRSEGVCAQGRAPVKAEILSTDDLIGTLDT